MKTYIIQSVYDASTFISICMSDTLLEFLWLHAELKCMYGLF